MKKILLFLCITNWSFAQSTTILPGGTNPNIQINGNNNGINIAGITSQQRDAIPNPSEGYTIYNKTTKCTEVFNGEYWFNLCDPNPKPTAEFAFNTNALTVSFSNNSSKALKYFWDFGNGTTSTSKNPSITFSNAGTYNVLLKVTNNFGESSFAQKITVAQTTNPVADFTFEINKKQVKFINTSQNGISFLWNFGNNTTSTVANPIVGYNQFGTYTVTLQTTNPTGSNSITKTITLTDTAPNTVTDIDGNIYNTVTIGTQVWFKENLNTTKFKNGEVIPQVTDNATWENLNSPAWCRHNNNPDNSNEFKFGLLYNGFVATDNRGVCPNGWRVPSVTDFNTLIQFLGGPEIAGGKIKQTGIDSFWSLPNTGATNETEFTALPSGWRTGTTTYWRLGGAFIEIGMGAHFLTRNNSPTGGVYIYDLWYQSNVIGKSEDLLFKTSGYSIRCIKE